jgi:hypothetical protein
LCEMRRTGHVSTPWRLISCRRLRIFRQGISSEIALWVEITISGDHSKLVERFNPEMKTTFKAAKKYLKFYPGDPAVNCGTGEITHHGSCLLRRSRARSVAREKQSLIGYIGVEKAIALVNFGRV